MVVAYVYCPHCYTEEYFVEVNLGDNYSNGRFVQCNNCEEETQDFDITQPNLDNTEEF